MARINEIVEQVQANAPDADVSLLEKAYVYSAKVHQGQMRLSGEPYLTHPLAVAEILAAMRMDPVTVAAGLLHDTVEDTFATDADIRTQFGDEIGDLVAGLTKLSKIEFQSREEAQAESHRESNRKHQRSPEGREDHRDRQREYVKRRKGQEVTDESCAGESWGRSLASVEEDQHELDASRPVCRWPPPEPPFCIVCRRPGFFIDTLSSVSQSQPSDRCRPDLR